MSKSRHFKPSAAKEEKLYKLYLERRKSRFIEDEEDDEDENKLDEKPFYLQIEEEDDEE